MWIKNCMKSSHRQLICLMHFRTFFFCSKFSFTTCSKTLFFSVCLWQKTNAQWIRRKSYVWHKPTKNVKKRRTHNIVVMLSCYIPFDSYKLIMSRLERQKTCLKCEEDKKQFDAFTLKYFLRIYIEHCYAFSAFDNVIFFIW